MNFSAATGFATQKPGFGPGFCGGGSAGQARGRAGRDVGGRALLMGGEGVRARAGLRIHNPFCREEFSAMPAGAPKKKRGAAGQGTATGGPGWAALTLAGRGGRPEPKNTR